MPLMQTLPQFLRNRIEDPGERDILRANSPRIVRGQIHADSVVHVEPLGVVAHGFNLQGGSRHEAEGMHEIGEFVFAVQLTLDELPAMESGQGGSKLLLSQLRHASILRRGRRSGFWDRGSGIVDDYWAGQVGNLTHGVRRSGGLLGLLFHLGRALGAEALELLKGLVE